MTFLLAVALFQADAAAALEKLAARLRDVKTLKARFVQERKTALTPEPLVSTGTLHYRREPARLVLRMGEPRKAEIHMDGSTYQVYRPAEQRLERIDFAGEAPSRRLLMIFNPRPEEIRKLFAIRDSAAGPGEIGIRLEPLDAKLKRSLAEVTLGVTAGESGLRRFSWKDAEGDTVEFRLEEVVLDGETDPGAFELKVAEGTRVLRHAAEGAKE